MPSSSGDSSDCTYHQDRHSKVLQNPASVTPGLFQLSSDLKMPSQSGNSSSCTYQQDRCSKGAQNPTAPVAGKNENLIPLQWLKGKQHIQLCHFLSVSPPLSAFSNVNVMQCCKENSYLSHSPTLEIPHPDFSLCTSVLQTSQRPLRLGCCRHPLPHPQFSLCIIRNLICLQTFCSLKRLLSTVKQK